MVRRRSKLASSIFGLGAAGSIFIYGVLGFLDLTINTQMISLSAAVVSLPFVNEPPKNTGDKRLKVTPAALFERLSWESKLPHDIDLWTACTGFNKGEKSYEIVVGYRRKSQGWLDLQRDVQGSQPINEEHLSSNSEVSKVPPNTTCTFNVHLYHSHGGTIPVEGRLFVIQNKDGDDENLLGDIKFNLIAPGQELTIIVATWDDHGTLVSVEKYPDVALTPIATGSAPSIGP